MQKKAKKNKEELNKDKVDVPVEIFLKHCGRSLVQLIDKTIINVKNEEPIPLKYRNPGNVIHWMFAIMAITTPDRSKQYTDEGDGTPFRTSEEILR